MTVEAVQIRNALVFRDADRPHLWYDAIGPGVLKHFEDGINFPNDDTTGDPTMWECTIVEVGAGDSTIVTTDVAGGALLITCAGNENDGYKMQLGMAAGEGVDLSGGAHLFVRARFAINDVDQTDILIGVCVTDTTALDAVADGMYFRSVDESAVLQFVAEKDSVESATNIATLTDAAYVDVYYHHDGSNVYVYVNNALAMTLARSDASFPNDELLRLTWEFLTGEATANTCTLTDLVFIYVP